MQTGIIELNAMQDSRGTSRAAHVLQTLHGVDRIVVTSAQFTIKVTYDDRITSIQEICEALRGSGYGVRAAALADTEIFCSDSQG